MFSGIGCATFGSDLPGGNAGPAAAITSLGAAGPAGNFSKHQLGAVGGGEGRAAAGPCRLGVRSAFPVSSWCWGDFGSEPVTRQFCITPVDLGQGIPDHSGSGEGE